MGGWKILYFPSFVFGWEGGKWRNGKLFCLVKMKFV